MGSESEARDPRRVQIVVLGRLDQCPRLLDAGARAFHLFVGGDFRSQEPKSLDAFARRSLDDGAVTVTLWGQRSGDLELSFDQASVLRGVRQGYGESRDNAVTTDGWPEDELDEALFSFLDHEAAPAYRDLCSDWVAVLLGEFPERKYIKDILNHPRAFIDRMVEWDGERDLPQAE